MMEELTSGVFLSAGAFGALCGVASAWIKAKFGQKVRAEIPQPCEVHQMNDCVSVKECNRRMRSLEERMDKMEQRFAGGFDNILRKLDAMDKRSEDRAIALNRRIDPMMERVAECRGQVELMKEQSVEAFKAATLGGSK